MDMRRYLAGVVFSVVFPAICLAEVIPDFYGEPGISEFRENVSSSMNESIDPLSGSLSFVHTEVVIPGNGGLDLSIVRSYNNAQQGDLGSRTTTGIGWTNHFGRVLAGQGVSGCSTTVTHFNDNPVIELQDGSRFPIALHTNGSTGITKERWNAGCFTDAQGNVDLNKYVVYSPEGMRYEMFEVSYESGEKIWHTTRISDPNDNWIDITYKEIGGTFSKYKVVDLVTTSDGRSAQYSYVDENNDNARLASINSHGRTWSYEYQHAGISNYYYLTKATRPDGQFWEYTYNTVPDADLSGVYSLNTVKNPYGALTTYSYQSVVLNNLTGQRLSAIKDKVVSEAGPSNGTWSYEFTPDTLNSIYDTTTVTTPNGKYLFKHYGLRPTPINTLWRSGLLKEKHTFSGASTSPIKKEIYEWEGQLISNERYTRPAALLSDDAYYAPLMTKKTIELDGSLYVTEYSNHDIHGNPGTIIETGNDTKRTDLTYFYNTSKWIIKRPKDETIQGIGTISRNFDADTGNLLSENKYGVVTSYTYHPTGDVHTITNARGFTSTYENYKRGKAQDEVMPEQVTMSSIVNDTGTVASKTNGRGRTTSYSYDTMNRVTNITYPGKSPVNITYQGLFSATLKRDGYEMKVDYDNLGQIVRTTQKDITRAINIYQTTEYNAVGQAVFKSYPNDVPSLTQGTRTTYDILNRPLVVTHADGTKMRYEYLTGNKVRVRNERNELTTFSYRSYGEPSAKSLVEVASPEAITTTIQRNTLDQITKVTQGTLSRDYGYDTRYYLVSRNDPEIGLSEFGRDAEGNRVSLSVAGIQQSSSAYDGLNRHRQTNYTLTNIQPGPNGEIPKYSRTVNYTYDANSNIVKLEKVDFQNNPADLYTSIYRTIKEYAYDDTDHLIRETLTLKSDRNGQFTSKSHAAEYVYTPLGHLSSIKYPKGRSVSYEPDALGRATKVHPFVTNVDYHPTGIPSQIVFANGQVSQTNLDARQRPNRYQTFGNRNDVDLSYVYDGVGNVTSITDSLEPQYSRSMTYDGIDRLVTANGQWGTGIISYDKVGNITSKSMGGTNLSYNYDVTNKLTTVTGSKSLNYAYDGRGNVVDTSKNSFFYDQTDRVRYVSGTSPVYYDYDGNGLRIRKIIGSDITEYFYANNGNLLGEYAEDGLTYKEYAYLGSQLVAMRDSSFIPPVANAGAPQFEYEGTPVTLNGTASSDADGKELYYRWTRLTGPTVFLDNAFSPTPTFTVSDVPSDSEIVMQLTVTDEDGLSSTDTVTITVLDAAPPKAVAGVYLSHGLTDITIRWDPSIKADSYDIYWSTAPGVTPVSGNKLSNVSSPYNHTGLTSGVTYYYVITASNIYGESEPSQEVSIGAGVNGVNTPENIGLTQGQTGDIHTIIDHPDGTRTLYYSDYETGIGRQLFRSVYTPGVGWSEPVVDTRVGLLGGGARIISDTTGNLLLVTVKDNQVVARYMPVGQQWGEEIVVSKTNGESWQRPREYQATLSSNGIAHITWTFFCCQPTYGSYRIRGRRLDVATGTLSKLQYHDSYGRVKADYKLSADDAGNALIAIVYGDGLFERHYDVTTGYWSERKSINYYYHSRSDFDAVMSETGYSVIATESTRSDLVKAYFFKPGHVSHQPTLTFYNGGVEKLYISNTGEGFSLYTSDNNELLLRRFDFVSGWSDTSELIGYGRADRADFVVDTTGVITITWIYDTPYPSTVSSVMLNRYQPGVGWGSQIRVGQASDTNGIYPKIASLNGQGALVTWSQFDFGSPSDGIYSSTYTHFSDTAGQQNSAPLALTTGRIEAIENSSVSLDATGSFDIDGTIVAYEWTQVSGIPVVLSGASTSTPSFTAPFVTSSEDFDFQVKVTDDRGESSFVIQEVRVINLPPPNIVTVLSGAEGNILSWNALTEADGYNLYWSTEPRASTTARTLIENVSSPYMHTGLTVGQDYYYVLVSVNADGESNYSREYKSTWKDGWQTPSEFSGFNDVVEPSTLSSIDSGDSIWVWEQTTTQTNITDVFASRFVPGVGWTTPEKINENDGAHSKPVSVTYSDGSHVVLWSTSDTIGTSIYSRRFTLLNGWEATQSHTTYPGVLTIEALGAGIDASGNILVSWGDSTNIYAMQYQQTTGWQLPQVIGEGNNPTLSLSQNGHASLSWTTNTIGGVVGGKNIMVSRYVPTTGWGLATQVATNVGRLIEGPVTTVDNAGNLMLIINAYSPNGYNSIQGIRYTASTGWGTLTSIDFDDANTTGLRLSGNANGDAVISWFKMAGVGEQTLFVRRFSAVTGWDDIERLELISNKVKGSHLSINSAGDIIATWYQDNPDFSVIRHRIFASLYTDGAWSVPEKINDTESIVVKTGSFKAHLSDVGNALIVWRSSDQSMTHYRKPSVASSNVRPVANAGVNRTVNKGELATIDATGSLDPDGTIASYTWTQLTGPSVVLDTTVPGQVSFTAPDISADTDIVLQLNIIDNSGAGHSDSITVTVTDPLLNNTIPPVVTAPAAITVEASDILTPISAATLGTASSLDDLEGALPVSSDAPGVYPLGITTITWSATDTAGNTGIATQVVTVVDTTAPSITPPADVGVQSDTPVSIGIGSPITADIFSPINVVNDAPSQFPVGSTTVTWTATDPNGNSSSATQTVTVTAPPAVNTGPVINGINASFVNGQIQLVADAVDPDNGPLPLSYQWSIVSGGGSLTTTTGATTYYILPSSNVTVTFKLIVSDGSDSAQINYTLTIGSGSGSANEAPYATGINAYYISSTQVQLVLSATDPDNGPSPLSYQWSILSGGGSLTNANTAEPIYSLVGLPPGSHTITFKVEVSDGEAVVPYTIPLTLTAF